MKNKYLSLIVAFFIFSCSPIKTPLEQKLLDGEMPSFNSYISPITVPIQPEYSPVKANFTYSIATFMSITENNQVKNKSEYLKMTGKTKISNIADQLVWDIDINTVVSEGKTVSPKQSLASLRLLTDKYGKMNEIELSSPALIAANVDHKEIDEFLKTIRSSMETFGSILPNTPVNSGDPITKIDKNTMLKILEEDAQNINMENDLKYIIDGWSVFNDKKVIVASIDQNFSIEMKNNVNLNFYMKGYNLFDSDTFQVIDGNLLIITEVSYKIIMPPCAAVLPREN